MYIKTAGSYHLYFNKMFLLFEIFFETLSMQLFTLEWHQISILICPQDIVVWKPGWNDGDKSDAQWWRGHALYTFTYLLIK